MQSSRLALLALTACGRLQFDDALRDAAGSGDGTSTDGAMGDGSPGIDCHVNHSAALFCDGFEDGPSMGPWDYTVLDFGSVDSTTLRSWGGARSLEAHTDGSANLKDARWGAFLEMPITTGELYIREYLWIATGSVEEQASVFVTGNGTPPYPSTFLLLEPGQLEISTDNNFFNFADILPRDQWVCVEMHIHIDSATGFVRMSFNGNVVYTTSATDTEVVGGYTQIEAGIHYATVGQSPVSLWVDDVVVDTAPIGCN